MAKQTSLFSTINDSTINSAKRVEQVTSAAQSQWFKRPADEKYASLTHLAAAVNARRHRAFHHDLDESKFRLVEDSETHGHFHMRAVVPIANKPGRELAIRTAPTHYAFGQLCSLIGAHSSYFRDKLADRPDLVIECINHGLSKRATEGVKILGVHPADAAPDGTLDQLMAITSQTYGRIWDADVVAAAQKIINGTKGRFESPKDWSREKRALFASDRDVFMFFCDGGSIVDGGGERDQLNRGFFLWNSEVGSKTFGIACFLFRQVCGNFGIWGAQDVRVMKIRHTSGGPERFVSDAIPALNEYVKMSTKPVEEAIRKAKALELPKADEEFNKYFLKRGLKLAEVRRAKEMADAEEGQHHTLWDMYNGLTATARTMAYAEAKVDLEKRAGALMEELTKAA